MPLSPLGLELGWGETTLGPSAGANRRSLTAKCSPSVFPSIWATGGRVKTHGRNRDASRDSAGAIADARCIALFSENASRLAYPLEV